MTEHLFSKDEPIEKLADATHLVEESNGDTTKSVELVVAENAHLELQEALNPPDEHAHLSITPHQFVRKKSRKYEPTVRPNFWIPIIYLLAGIIPYALYFGAAFFIEPFYLPKPFPESPPAINGHNGTLTAILYCLNASIPSFIGEITALFLLKRRNLKPWVAVMAWLLFMIFACVAFVYISIAAAGYWVH